MSDQKYTWHVTTADNWETPNSHRGYTGAITYTAGTGYVLTITGSGAPAPSTHTTLKGAKGQFRKYLQTK